MNDDLIHEVELSFVAAQTGDEYQVERHKRARAALSRALTLPSDLKLAGLIAQLKALAVRIDEEDGTAEDFGIVVDAWSTIEKLAALRPAADPKAEGLVELIEQLRAVAAVLRQDRPYAAAVAADAAKALATFLAPPTPDAERAGEPETFAWLVESFSGQHDNYLSGFEEAYAGSGFAWFPTWTDNHLSAMRFARKADAMAIALNLSPTTKAKAVEHGWIGTVVSPKSPATEAVTEAMVERAYHAYVKASGLSLPALLRTTLDAALIRPPVNNSPGGEHIVADVSKAAADTVAMVERVYLAARYSRAPELRAVRDELVAHGYTVTSRWIDGGHELTKEGSTQANEAERARFAVEDEADCMAAGIIINFTEEPRKTTTRGGRHVEFGMGRASGKRLIVVGHRENVFHCLPGVEYFETWSTARTALIQEAAPPADTEGATKP